MDGDVPSCYRNALTCKLKDLKFCAKKKMDCYLVDAVAPDCVDDSWS